jgi:hypothetical protein
MAAQSTQPEKFSEDTSASPKYRVTRDHNYIYVKRPKALVFDNEEQESMQKIDQVIREQLGQLRGQNVSDPDGDLKALDDSMSAFQQQVDQLVKVTGQVYNEVKHSAWFKADPTALMIFGGVEYDASFVKFISGGGSFMVGLVAMPMEVRKYRIDTREFAGSSTEWDTAWIGIPALNVGPGVTSSAGGTNPRAGVGLVWGDLNSASEVTGFTVGPSVTAQLWKGINVKVLGLKNMSKRGAINNTVVMVGLEPANASPKNNMSILGYAAEAHVSLSGMVDLASMLSPITHFLSSSSGE